MKKVYLNRMPDCVGELDEYKNSLKVLKGCKISPTVARHFENSRYDYLRDELLSSGVIKQDEFVSDYTFSSPSEASSIILGSITSGPREWGQYQKTEKKGVNQRKSSSRKTSAGKQKKLMEDLIRLAEEKREAQILEAKEKILEELMSLKEYSVDAMQKIAESLRVLEGTQIDLEYIKQVVEELYHEHKNEQEHDGGS